MINCHESNHCARGKPTDVQLPIRTMRCLLFHFVAHDVDVYRHNNDESDRDLLPKVIQPDQIEAVAQHTHDKGSDHRSKNAARPPCKARCV